MSHFREAGGPEAPFHLGYRPWLDGLRGVAILLVLGYHFRLITGGFLGVDVFFVLSGFLITALLAEEWQGRGAISLKRFYLRRGLRLLPAFFALLAGCYLFALLFRPAGELKQYQKEACVAASYVTNWPRLHGVSMPTLGHTWSLSIEEQFYLLWPVLLYAALRSGLSRRQILLLVGAGVIAAATARWGLYRVHRWGRPSFPEELAYQARLYTGLYSRADALLIGCLAGLLVAWGLLPRSARARFWLGVAALAAGAALLCAFSLFHHIYHRQLYEGVFTLVALAVAVIVVRLFAAPSSVPSSALAFGPLVWVGRLSYSLYLFHIPVMRWLRPEGSELGFTPGTLLVTALTFAAAALSYYGIERPCLRLKGQFQTSRPAGPAEVAAQIAPAARAA